MWADGAGEEPLAKGVGEASLAARSIEVAEEGGLAIEDSGLSPGRPGASGAGRLEEGGGGGGWGEEANCRGGAMVAGGGVDAVEWPAVVTTGGVQTPPGAGDGMLEAAEANGEKAPIGLNRDGPKG